MSKIGRPPKDKRLLLRVPLRVMLTDEQKSMIEGAAKMAGLDMTAWARPILVEAARAAIGNKHRQAGRPAGEK